MTTMGIQTGVTRMVAKWLTHYVYLLLKAAIVKLFAKLSKILGRIATFYFYQGFFSEHCYGFAFAMTSCLQKVKVGKKKVLERSSFDNLFLIISLTSSSITTTLSKKLNFKILKSV